MPTHHTRKAARTVMDRLLRLVTARARLENQPLDYGPGLRLTPGEMHAIQAIGDSEGLKVTALADHFGVTKSAASQMVARLVRQELARKERAAHSNREYRLALTERGRRAHAAHAAVHEGHERRLRERLARFSVADLDTAAAVLDAVLEIVVANVAENDTGKENR